jgi:hypothetical protein
MTKHHFPVKPETWCAFVRQPQDGSIFGPQQPGGARYLVTPPHPMRYIGLHPATEVGGLKVYTADNEGAGGNGYATLCQGQILDLGEKMEEFEIDRLYMSSGNIMLEFWDRYPKTSLQGGRMPYPTNNVLLEARVREMRPRPYSIPIGLVNPPGIMNPAPAFDPPLANQFAVDARQMERPTLTWYVWWEPQIPASPGAALQISVYNTLLSGQSGQIIQSKFVPPGAFLNEGGVSELTVTSVPVGTYSGLSIVPDMQGPPFLGPAKVWVGCKTL